MPMQIIPVIDLMDGRVAHARHGDREHYRPLRSMLCDTCEPLGVARAIMGLHPFRTLYIADLDAIRGRGHNRQHIDSIRRHHPELTLWVDTGFRDAHALGATDRIRPVIGSESQSTAHMTRRHRDAVLSLDFLGDAFLGPPQLFANSALWPPQIIVMSLSRVGSAQGPDIARLKRLIARSPTSAWYAGGGVRHANDLRALVEIGLRGALIASALHNKAIDASVLAAYK
jgi:phosphoribosylformimino-5-aminoimidazole carboxamide ribotide isomerase